MYNYAEKRKYIRIEKPYMARFRVKPEGNQGVVSTGWDMVAVNDLFIFGVVTVFTKIDEHIKEMINTTYFILRYQVFF